MPKYKIGDKFQATTKYTIFTHEIIYIPPKYRVKDQDYLVLVEQKDINSGEVSNLWSGYRLYSENLIENFSFFHKGIQTVTKIN